MGLCEQLTNLIWDDWRLPFCQSHIITTCQTQRDVWSGCYKRGGVFAFFCSFQLREQLEASWNFVLQWETTTNTILKITVCNDSENSSLLATKLTAILYYRELISAKRVNVRVYKTISRPREWIYFEKKSSQTICAQKQLFYCLWFFHEAPALTQQPAWCNFMDVKCPSLSHCIITIRQRQLVGWSRPVIVSSEPWIAPREAGEGS